jgi:hypothetical protein
MKSIKNNVLRILAALILSLGSAILVPVNANPVRFVALGDMPYRSADEPAFASLITEINQTNPAFTVFVGDTKSGGSPCTNAYLESILESFSRFENALIYTPGDNEWTDCHRPSAGSFDPEERLQFIRKLYFPNSYSLGKKPLHLIRQADLNPKFNVFVENAYWINGSTLFATVHVVGSNNNFENTSEYAMRNRANLAWLDYVVKVAQERALDHLVIAMQADLFYSAEQASSAKSGLRETIGRLNQLLSQWNKPALVIHGDSHQLIIDQPFKHPGSKRVIERAYRVQVMGDYQVEALEITIDSSKRSPFSFRPLIIR